MRIGAVNPNVFQDDEYKLGSFGNPDPGIQEQALDHVLECCEIMTKVDSDVLSLWFADGTNYAGQDNLRARKRRFEHGLRRGLQAPARRQPHADRVQVLRAGLLQHRHPRLGHGLRLSLKLGEQAQVLVDLGHHAQGVNIEQIVAFLLDEGKLGGFHFNNRKYADDDLIVGSVNPYELFLIYNELVGGRGGRRRRWSATRPSSVAYMLDQCHNIEGKMAADDLSVMNCQEAYAKALCVPARRRWPSCGRRARSCWRHKLLTDAFRTDVRPLLAQVREEMGVPVDPIAAYRACGYEEKMRKERGLRQRQRRLPIIASAVTNGLQQPMRA